MDAIFSLEITLRNGGKDLLQKHLLSALANSSRLRAHRKRGGAELRQSDPHVRLARLGLYRGVGSLTVLEVARDNEQKSQDAQHGNPDPEIEHEIWQVFELLGAKWDLSVRKKFGELGDPAVVTCADESLKNFSVRPVAHVEHGTGEQRSYCSAQAKPEV